MDARFPSSHVEQKTVVNVWQREIGQLSVKAFKNRQAASEDRILGLHMYKKLEKEQGYLYTLIFNGTGDILISPFDESIVFWDFETQTIKFSFESGHHKPIYQVKSMPFRNGQSIISCGDDGEVRYAEILPSGRVATHMLGMHEYQACDLAIQPGSPCIFYSCGYDGTVKHYDVRTRAATRVLDCQPIEIRRSNQRYVSLNAIAIDEMNPNSFAVAGTDGFIRIFDIRRHNRDGSSQFGQPTNILYPSLLSEALYGGIKKLVFSHQSELLVSCKGKPCKEAVCIFTKDMILGHENGSNSDLGGSSSTRDDAPQVYTMLSNDFVHDVKFFGPKCEYVMGSCSRGKIYVWKKKCGKLVRVMRVNNDTLTCIAPHPHEPILAACGYSIWIWT